ncbi:MAG: hypothetical protein U0Q15_16000 [Kineosporiaceae bacterium]
MTDDGARTGRIIRVALAVAALMGASACGQGPAAQRVVAARPLVPESSPSAPPTSAAVTATPSLVTSSARATRPPTTTSRRPARTTQPRRRTTPRPRVAVTADAAAAASERGCSVPAGVRSTRVVVVSSRGTRATVTACRRSGSRYVADLGPFSGWVGRSGTVSASSKREGDGHTPRGVFPLRTGFGTAANPGLAAGWLRVGASDVWVDDPESALYNTHQRDPAAGRWASAERLQIAAYRYAQVIGWNESRRAGRGSAIFLHVSTGGPTAGCVSLPTDALKEVLRWERPGAVIAIS